MSYEKKVENAAKLIRACRKVFVLTGAGISTESGLPDFRSPGTGLWEKIDPTQYSTAQVLYHDPEKFYQYGFSRFRTLSQAEPNRAHKALSWLEEKGIISGIITQNIDGLHKKAGSRAVWEVHGHLRTGYCVSCYREYPFEVLMNQLDNGKIPPVCDCGSMLRPSVVLFGDALGEEFFRAEQELSRGCELMIVAGSSLKVFPVASLPHRASRLIIINLQPTPYDREAEFLFQENCGDALESLVKQIDSQE